MHGTEPIVMDESAEELARQEQVILRSRLKLLQAYDNSENTPETKHRCAEIARIFNRLREIDQGAVEPTDLKIWQARANRARRYLPTLSDLVDRLSIVQMKSIFIYERKTEYTAEMKLIMHDIDLILDGLDRRVGAKEVHAILVLMLANRCIWESESKAREGSSEQDKLLKFSHSANGVRNTAKNVLATIDGGRHDFKIDALSESLIPEFGNWDIWNGDQ